MAYAYLDCLTGPAPVGASNALIGLVNGRQAVIKGSRWLAQSEVGAEILASVLAPLIGVPVPDWAIIELSPEHPLDDGRAVLYRGKLFASYMVADLVDLRAAWPHIARFSNRDSFAAIFVLDQWILNNGRNLPVNCLFRQDGNALQVLAIDHAGATAINAGLGNIRGDINPLHIYSRSSDHFRCMRRQDIETAYARIGAVSVEAITAAVQRVPVELYGNPPCSQARLIQFIVDRARYLASQGMDILRSCHYWGEIPA